LEAKEEKNAPEEALDTAAFAQFFSRPSWRQAGAIFLASGIPRNNGDSSQYGMNPGNEAQAPIGSIQTNDTRTDLVKLYCPG
jgi:hypothetical protein